MLSENPERLAWTVLLLAFTTFCMLVILVPLGVRHYLLNSMEAETTAVTSVRGTVLAEPRNANVPIPVTDGTTLEIEEETTITTDNTSQAVLIFFNDSTLTLYGETSVTIVYARSPRFDFSHRPDTIIVDLKRGRVRVAPSTTTGTQRGLLFETRSPQAVSRLGEGSFSVEVNEGETQVTARLGEAELTAHDQTVHLQTGERSVVRSDEEPSPPLPAEQNLLVNGDFAVPLEGSWEVYTSDAPGSEVTTSMEIVDIRDQRAVRFFSLGEDSLHSEIGIKQNIEKSVQDFDSLRVQLAVRLDYQSLPGGGTLGSEFPMMIHVAYKDAEGNDRDWYHGFYYSLAPENWVLHNTPDNSSERIAQYVWYPYESPNLLDSLGAAKPVYMKYVRLYASGWLYDAYVADIALLAQD